MTDIHFQIALWLIIICNFGILRLFYVMQQDTYDTRRSVNRLHSRLDTVLRRIAQVKTRLADEERDDQAEKRRQRVKA